MNIAMISCHDEAYAGLGAITSPNKEEYCQKWGYYYFCKTEGFAYPNYNNGNRHDQLMGFEKLQMILDLFEEKPDLDWIHWTGADLIVTNYNVRIENIVDDSYHMIVCVDINGMNVDSMIVKNSRVGRGLMRWVLDNIETYRHANWYEQQALIDFFFKAPLARDIIKILPQRVMNSYDYTLYRVYDNMPHVDHTGTNGQWQPGDFMFQAPGLSVEDRIRVMQHYIQRVIK